MCAEPGSPLQAASFQQWVKFLRRALRMLGVDDDDPGRSILHHLPEAPDDNDLSEKVTRLAGRALSYSETMHPRFLRHDITSCSVLAAVAQHTGPTAARPSATLPEARPRISARRRRQAHRIGRSVPPRARSQMRVPRARTHRCLHMHARAQIHEVGRGRCACVYDRCTYLVCCMARVCVCVCVCVGVRGCVGV